MKSVLWFALGMLLAATLSGCATLKQYKPKDGSEQAVWIIWRSYGRTDHPPLIRWKEGDALNCEDPNSGKPGFKTIVGCREGFTWTPFDVWVAWHGEASFSETALAHELMHSAQLREGIVDPLHKTQAFQPGGAVDRANGLLLEAGK